MAKIQIKRGQSANLPAALDAGEPAFALDTGKLYVGTGDSKTLINPDKSTAATTADKLTTARMVKLTGEDMDTSGVQFDGSANVVLNATLGATGVTAGTYPKVTVNAKGRVTAGAALVAGDIPSLPTTKITGLGSAATVNTGTSSGNVPLLDATGKIDTGVLPAIAITDTFEVATQAAMLALTAQRGDVAIRSDLNKSFILADDTPSELGAWKELKTPTDAVLSVAGRTGAVTVSKTDVGLSLVDNVKQYSASNVPPYPVTSVNGGTGAVSVTLASLAGAPLSSPALTGTPTAPTAAVATNTTQIATTAFVKSQGYLTSASVIDGGTF